MNEDLHSEPSEDAAVRVQLDAALGDACLPTGTLVAHVLHDLFLSEARQHGRYAAEQAWHSLDAPAIAEIGREFTERISRPNGSDYFLPAGTVMIVCMFGCAIIGSEELGLDVDRPGLHDNLDLPTRPGGSNLAHLLRHVDELTRGLPCRAIGMPTLIDRFSGRHPEHHLQFPAFAPAGGVVLQRGMDFTSWGEFFCAFTQEMIERLAAEIVHDMQRLWTDGQVFAPRIRSTRKAANRIAARVRGVRVHAVTLDIGKHPSGGDGPAVEFEGWDHAFRRDLVVQKIISRRYQQSGLDAAALDLADEVAALHALGGDGRINVLARAIANAAPQGAAAVLANLASKFETFVTLPTRTGPLPLRLYWQRGEIGAETRGRHKIEVTRENVMLRRETHPETIIGSLPGKPVTAVFDQPFRCNTRIAHVENKNGDLIVTPEQDPWLVNCRTGRMWPDAAFPTVHAAVA